MSVRDVNKYDFVAFEDNLNTTLVSVRALAFGRGIIVINEFKYNSCVGSRLTIMRDALATQIRFKYNSCVGSRKSTIPIFYPLFVI